MLTLYKGVVHPWLCDAMGHLTTRHYIGMFDDASYHLFHQAFGYAGPFADFEGKGWADVKHVIEYKAEVPAGALVEIRGELVKLGGKSLTARYELINLVSGKLAASMDSVTAFFDLKARNALPLTDDMRAAAARFIKP